MSINYEDYYLNQAGTGLGAFQGYRYQRGHGFFGNIFRNILKPIAKYLGRKGLEAGVAVGKDYLDGNTLKTSLKKRLKETGMTIADDALEKVKAFAQKGNGKKRKLKTTICKGKNPKKKRKKQNIKKKTKTKGKKTNNPRKYKAKKKQKKKIKKQSMKKKPSLKKSASMRQHLQQILT